MPRSFIGFEVGAYSEAFKYLCIKVSRVRCLGGSVMSTWAMLSTFKGGEQPYQIEVYSDPSSEVLPVEGPSSSRQI